MMTALLSLVSSDITDAFRLFLHGQGFALAHWPLAGVGVIFKHISVTGVFNIFRKIILK